MDWTDERVAELRALWDEGLSVSQIGKRLGITKNAVTGKVDRLRNSGVNIPARPSPLPPAKPSAPKVRMALPEAVPFQRPTKAQLMRGR